MTSFEELVAAFSRGTGIDVKIEDGDSISLEADGMVVTAKYDKDNGVVTIFAPVSDPENTEKLSVNVLRTALKLSFNGAGTYGNYLGLVENTLMLSCNYHINDLDAENFAQHFLDLEAAAVAVRDRILNYSQDQSDTKKTQPATISHMGMGISV